MGTRATLVIAFAVAAATFAGGRAVSAQATSGQPAQRGGAAPPTPPCGPNLSVKNVDKQSRCFELRTYTVRDGSSIDVLHARFREHTSALFIKHGMTIVGYWQPLAKPNTLVYMLAYKDAAARDAAWTAFNADPEWVKVRTEMQVDVQVDSQFMSATDYSPMK